MYNYIVGKTFYYSHTYQNDANIILLPKYPFLALFCRYFMTVLCSPTTSMESLGVYWNQSP